MYSKMAMKEWIDGDESAKEMFARLQKERLSLLLPPLHRVALRAGNVVELVGPSPSAKTQVLIQTAVSCILPKEWNGVPYGGLERSVFFVDLDCRFDILRLAQILKLRIAEVNGSVGRKNLKQKPDIAYNEELYAICMRRFMYVRCYGSLDFLAILKTLHHQLQTKKEHGINVHLLMIDSIGAFHWVDRASSFLPPGGNNRKSVTLSSLSEAVVQDIKKLLLVHPMLVIATKSTILGDRSANMMKQKLSSPDTSDMRDVKTTFQQLPYREYMPLAWQSFVTHRVLFRPSDYHLAMNHNEQQLVYLSEWLLPSMSFLDKFIVKDAGVFIV